MKAKTLPVSVALIFIISLLKPDFVPAQATDSFSTSAATTYTVTDDNSVRVDQRITLINLTDEHFVEEYNLLIPTDDLETIHARDSSGDILSDYLRRSGQTQIRLEFDEPLIGAGEKRTFRITYKTKQLIDELDNGWRIELPAPPASTRLVSYTAELIVPSDWPKGKFIPPPSIQRGNRYIYDLSQLKAGEAKATFVNELPTLTPEPKILGISSPNLPLIPFSILILGMGAGIAIITIWIRN